MQNDTSQFVVNIVPLQNIQTDSSGLDATAQLNSAVANIQQMVNFDQKRIFTDSLSAFTTGGTIQVISPMNMSDVPLTLSGTAVTGSGSGSGSFTSLVVTGTGTFGGSVSATAFITLSDMQKKKEKVVLTNPFAILESVQPYKYFLEGEETKQRIGLLAQEVEAVCPEACQRGVDGNLYVEYNSIVALLVGAVKNLRNEIDELKKRID
jgi:hypothetical protein